MVRALEQNRSMQKSKSFHFKRMFEIAGRQAQSFADENGNNGEDDRVQSRSHTPRIARDSLLEQQQIIGWALDRSNDNKGPVSCLGGNRNGSRSPTALQSDMEMMKEKFSKLLLGEDMSGGGKGVSSALALSNAITNLAASVFGEQSKLEPMSPERKARWRKEIDWLLSVTDHIVAFVPSQQTSPDGTTMEIMVTRQRNDLHVNIPALRKLDAMLIGYLDNFKDQNEFWYGSKDEDDSSNGNCQRKDDKWWLPSPKVPTNGLSDISKKWLQFQKESVNQVLKAAMAINAQVLSEIEIPESYIESLPKNGRSSLGDSIYKSITVEYFDPEQFLSEMDLSTEHSILDLKNRIEASIVIWKRKMNHKDGKSHWGTAISLEKRELFEERAETILLIIKQRFPGISQSALDISKIQYNRDVGYAILESYSRVLESLAHTVISRIEDVLYADSLAQNLLPMESNMKISTDSSPMTGAVTQEETENLNSAETPNSKTLSDFMGWPMDQGETEMKKSNSTSNLEELSKGESEKIMTKLANIVTNKKISYIEKFEILGGLRSPTARH